jgi:hypothetical protein
MTDAILPTERWAAVRADMQHQQQTNGGGFEVRARSDIRVEGRLPDAISLPMTQYFQRPTRQYSRVAG